MSMWSVINQGIGHWPPSEMDGMPIDELIIWYEMAVENIEARNEANAQE